MNIDTMYGYDVEARIERIVRRADGEVPLDEIRDRVLRTYKTIGGDFGTSAPAVKPTRPENEGLFDPMRIGKILCNSWGAHTGDPVLAVLLHNSLLWIEREGHEGWTLEGVQMCLTACKETYQAIRSSGARIIPMLQPVAVQVAPNTGEVRVTTMALRQSMPRSDTRGRFHVSGTSAGEQVASILGTEETLYLYQIKPGYISLSVDTQEYERSVVVRGSSPSFVKEVNRLRASGARPELQFAVAKRVGDRVQINDVDSERYGQRGTLIHVGHESDLVFAEVQFRDGSGERFKFHLVNPVEAEALRDIARNAPQSDAFVLAYNTIRYFERDTDSVQRHLGRGGFTDVERRLIWWTVSQAMSMIRTALNERVAGVMSAPTIRVDGTELLAKTYRLNWIYEGSFLDLLQDAKETRDIYQNLARSVLEVYEEHGVDWNGKSVLPYVLFAPVLIEEGRIGFMTRFATVGPATGSVTRMEKSEAELDQEYVDRYGSTSD